MILHRRFPSWFLSDRFGSRIELPKTAISMPNQPSDEPIIFHLTVNWLSRPDAYQAAPSSAKAGRATGRAAVLNGQNADAGRLRKSVEAGAADSGAAGSVKVTRRLSFSKIRTVRVRP